MRYVSAASLAVLSMLSPAMLLGQGLSITNYQFVSQQIVSSTQSRVTYRADLVNSGVPLASVTATVSSLNIFAVRTVSGQDTLTFAPVPGNTQITGSGTFTLLVNTAQTFSFSNIQWSFQTTAAGPVANAGPNQTVNAGTLVTLDGSGSTNPSGIGTLTYSWQFSSRPVGTNTILNNWWTVSPNFVADVQGTFVITLKVSNGTASSSASVTISTVNSAPVANAGPNQTVLLGSSVTLNGSGSSDVDGDPLTYQWSLIASPVGSTASLSGAATVSPSFVVDKPGNYVAQLWVYDGHGNSASSKVTITTQNTPPVANAGPGQVPPVGAVVQLNGSNSTDVDGDPLTFQWSLISLPAGSKATLSNPNAVSPTFTIDTSGTYVAQLIVNDGHFNSTPATVSITTNSTLPPTANAGPNQTVLHGTTVQLNGSGTDQQSLPLTFQWSLLNKPAGSSAVLSSATISNPTFVADLLGTYVVQLVVNNGFLNSAPSTVTITTTNTPPVANAGPPQNVTAGVVVTLDGSGSSDADNDPLTYSWSLLSRPDGSVTFLAFQNTVAAKFVADVAGTYLVQLIVNDGIANSDPSTVTIVAVPPPPIALTPTPLNLLTNGSGSLTVTLMAPAGTGGQIINLASSNTSIATVPTSVTVPQGSTTANVTVTPVAAGSASITATATGFSAGTATVNVANIVITLAPNPLNMAANASSSLTLSLSVPAGAGGQIINLVSTSPSVATVPPTVTVSPGSTSANVTVTPVSAGSITIAGIGGRGFTTGTATVNVANVQITLTPNPLNMGNNATAQLTVTLSAPAGASGQVINLASSNKSVASVPLSVTVPPGSTTVSATVTPGSAGTASITASAAGSAFTPGTATVNVVNVAQILLPANVTVGPGQTAAFPVTLAKPAPAGGLIVSLVSSDTSKLTVSPTNFLVPAGATAPASAPKITGVDFGSATITASAFGLTSASQQIQVTATLSFFPGAFTITGTTRRYVSLTLSAPAPANGVSINLSSGNTGVATVPASVTFAAGATSVNVPVTGVAAGSTLIHASALPNIADTTASVTVQ